MAKDSSHASSPRGAAPRKSLLGKKIGMTQVYTEAGERVPVTVLQAGPCTVLQVKSLERDGYAAVQVGFDETRKPRKRPQQAYLEKIGVSPQRFVREIPFVEPSGLMASEEAESAKEEDSGEKKDEVEGDGGGGLAGGGAVVPGARVGVGVFKDVKRVDVRGVTKGRGFAGVIRRYHFNAGPKSHGTKNIREPGSTGMHTDPGRVHKGKKMPGHLGAALRKARNLAVMRIEEAENLLLVQGSVPGPNGGYVYIEESLRKD
jgi:large subunit ribosomal protein L3